MIKTPAPTDQRARVKPIAFVLQNKGFFSAPVTLKIRPEELNKSEPSRVTVHQTLGKETIGWVDGFGAALPSVNISGNTGWRASVSDQKDGVAAFEALHQMVQIDYHEQRQLAINSGVDPALVKLLFIDILDDFVWNVTPTAFQLRRSKSRPLLMMYNISLQAISIDIDNPFKVLPFGANLPAGLAALSRVVAFLRSVATSIKGWVETAVGVVDAVLKPIGAIASELASQSLQVFDAVYGAVSAINNGVSGTANTLITIAADLASVGVNAYRTFAAIAGIPEHIKAALARVASAYNEVLCIFNNSLKPAPVYEEYTGLYGASNCSSTTGGRAPSAYGNQNVFSLMQDQPSPVWMSTSAQTSAATLGRGDPVLAPMHIDELGRHMEIISDGVVIQ